MTSPRHRLVDPTSSGYYHCMSRCVRRAFLCGEDRVSGQSFEHRKAWLADRAVELAGIFAVGLYAYAVMSNHVHLVLYLDPSASAQWSDVEVAERWLRLFPVRDNGEVDVEACHLRAQVIAMDAERVAIYRIRLASLSWFMRCLSEPFARRANREDGCTGRFWEGRYKCQALLDDAAVLACMTYVDLNPVRAGVADDLASSDHTSIQRRLGLAKDTVTAGGLLPIASSVPDPQLPDRDRLSGTGGLDRTHCASRQAWHDRDAPAVCPTAIVDTGARVAMPGAGYRKPLLARCRHGRRVDRQSP